MIVKIYTPDEVAEMLKVSPLTIRTWLKTGKLTGIKTSDALTGRWRITEQDINTYLDKQREKTNSGK